MPDDDVLRFDADASQSVAELKKLVDAVLSGYNPAMAEAARMTRTFSDENDQLDACIRRTLDLYVHLAGSLNNIRGAQEQAVRTAQALAAAYQDDLIASLKNLRGVQDQNVRSAQALSDALDNRLGQSLNNLRGVQDQNVASAKALSDAFGGNLTSSLNNLRGVQDQNVASAKALSDAFGQKLLLSLNNVQGVQEQAIRTMERRTQATKVAAEETRRLAEAEQREHDIKSRNASAAGASFGGSGSISFTSLGRSLYNPSASLATNFATGAGVGLALNAAGKFKDEIEEGAKRSQEFQLQVARIQAITSTSMSSTAAWSKELLRLSDSYNVPAAEVAKAAYEGVSRGVLKSSVDTRTLAESLKLARATGADAKDSMTALNDIMSTYGASADDAAKTSELLFQATKHGGLSMQELGSTLGRITAIAQPMGVSVKEIIAALEVMRSKGIAAGNGVAGLSQLLVELQKPSKLTKEALTQLGFASGQSAIATLGMLGAFRAVSDQVQKNGHDIAELFPNIRALRTDLILTSDAAVQYEQSLKGLGRATNDLSAANELAAGAPGQKWLKFINDWDNGTSELGKHWLELKDVVASVLSKSTDAERLAEALAKLDARTKGEIEAKVVPKPFTEEQQDEMLTSALNRHGGVASAPGVMGSAIAQNNLEDYGMQTAVAEAQVSSMNELFHKQLLILQQKNIGQNAAMKEELKAVQENREAYVEELKKKVEASRDASEKMAMTFDEGKLSRALRRTELNQGAQHLSPKQQLAAEDELRQKRVDELKDTLSQKLTHFDSLQGKQFTESKDPAEIERIQQEILKLEETRASVATTHAHTVRERDNIEEELVKKQQEQLDIARQIEEIQKRHAKRADDMLKIDDKQRNAMNALGVGPNKDNFADFSRSLAYISGQGGGTGDSTQRAMSQDMAQRLSRIPGMENIVKALKPENAIGGYMGPDFSDPATRRAQAAQAADAMGGVIAPTPTKEDIAQRLAAIPGMSDIVQALQTGAIGVDKYAQHIIQGQDAISTHYVRATMAVDDFADALREGAATWRSNKPGAEKGGWEQESSYGAHFGNRAAMLGIMGGVGGALGFADGGGVPGPTDVIPAMLTPGEYVSTAAATRTFYPVLEAMNKYARGFAEGGAVTTNVGDVNVTVRGGNTAPETVEEIGRGLRRALRRRTIRLD